MLRNSGSNPCWSNETLSKITKILFLIEDISEHECWHLVLEAWFLGCSGKAPGLQWKCLGYGGKAPGLHWKCLGCSGNGSLRQDWIPGSIMGNDVRGREKSFCYASKKEPLDFLRAKNGQNSVLIAWITIVKKLQYRKDSLTRLVDRDFPF